MTSKTVLSLAIFAIIILFTGAISPTLLITEADALKAKINYKQITNSKKVCGDELCSTGQTPIAPKGVTILPDSASNENPDAQMLFVQTAPSGTFEIKDGRQILTLNDISPTTIYFSDRPDRITGFLETELFFALWGEGENSFASNPPNAALELLDANDQSNIFILELTNPMFSPESEILQYDVIILEDTSDGLTQYDKRNDSTIPATFEHSVLFIDSLGSWFKDKAHTISHPKEWAIVDAGDVLSDESHKLDKALFVWNSCYTGSGANADMTFNYKGPQNRCVEQWGSYALACDVMADVKRAPDTTCKDISFKQDGMCPNGTYSEYDSDLSFDVSASAYTCVIISESDASSP